MSTDKEYLNFILEQLSDLEDITYIKMMGEYIIYFRGKIIAYICDNRFLVKPVETAKKLLPNAIMEPPYDGAKDMILVDNIDNKEFLKQLFIAMYPELPERKKK
ncbi:competence protein TfoX [bacterium]|nr:competence protein TfoX [bacterium]